MNRANTFTPGLSWKVSATTTSGATAAAAAAGTELCVYNAALVPAVVTWGGSSATAVAPTGTAAANSHVVAPGSTQVFTIGDATHVAVKTESSTGDIYFSRGYGA